VPIRFFFEKRAFESKLEGIFVFYLWPSAGGIKFQFSFRPRFDMNAMSAPSMLYDYYNPEANAVVLPVGFAVQ
jgi:hypothetical protein